MTGIGTLNGQPVGPKLPPSVPCPNGCQAPVWVAVDMAVHHGKELIVAVDDVLELDLSTVTVPWGQPPWTLAPHRCRT